MEYELKHYYRVKYALVCARQSFLKDPPKDDFEEYAKKVIDRAYFIILNIFSFIDTPRSVIFYIFQHSPCNISIASRSCRQARRSYSKTRKYARPITFRACCS